MSEKGLRSTAMEEQKEIGLHHEHPREMRARMV
jgi:hypothetical protein